MSTGCNFSPYGPLERARRGGGGERTREEEGGGRGCRQAGSLAGGGSGHGLLWRRGHCGAEQRYMTAPSGLRGRLIRGPGGPGGRVTASQSLRPAGGVKVKWTAKLGWGLGAKFKDGSSPLSTKQQQHGRGGVCRLKKKKKKEDGLGREGVARGRRRRTGEPEAEGDTRRCYY